MPPPEPRGPKRSASRWSGSLWMRLRPMRLRLADCPGRFRARVRLRLTLQPRRAARTLFCSYIFQILYLVEHFLAATHFPFQLALRAAAAADFQRKRIAWSKPRQLLPRVLPRGLALNFEDCFSHLQARTFGVASRSDRSHRHGSIKIPRRNKARVGNGIRLLNYLESHTAKQIIQIGRASCRERV